MEPTSDTAEARFGNGNNLCYESVCTKSDHNAGNGGGGVGDADGAVREFALDGYAHVQQISSSASHVTLVAQSDSTKELVHIRVYALEQLRKDAALRDHIERWVLVGCRARHPHIVRGMPSFISDTDLFFVEEHCIGGELLVALDTYYRSVGSASSQQPLFQCLPLSFIRCIIRDVMSAMDYLHTTCGVAHRSIKLENIFLDSENCAKLGRLGTCAAIAASETSGGMLQLCSVSKHYAAPELVMGQSYKGEPVDVWAAGVVLFVLLTGRFPFERDDNDEDVLFERICRADNVLQSHPALALVPDSSAADLVRDMLRVNPKSRPTAREVLQHKFLLTT